MAKKSKKLDRQNAMQSLGHQLEKYYTQLANANDSKEITPILFEIIKTYQEFVKVLGIIENSAGGQGNPGNINLLELSKVTFLELEKKLNRSPKLIEFQNEMNTKINYPCDKNLERIHRKLMTKKYWLFEEIKKDLLINK